MTELIPSYLKKQIIFNISTSYVGSLWAFYAASSLISGFSITETLHMAAVTKKVIAFLQAWN